MFLVDFPQFLMVFVIFFTFDILIISHWKVVESRATTHFAQNFQLYQMDALKMMSDKPFQKSKRVSHAFSKKSAGEVIFKIFQYTAIDRELRELSKSLLTFDSAARFHRKNPMTKGGL